ncbi:hypothetical protein NEUTE1DRAFT_28886, partial [Neurospora tetrasperma FGSC 2508]
MASSVRWGIIFALLACYFTLLFSSLNNQAHENPAPRSRFQCLLENIKPFQLILHADVAS